MTNKVFIPIATACLMASAGAVANELDDLLGGFEVDKVLVQVMEPLVNVQQSPW